MHWVKPKAGDNPCSGKLCARCMTITALRLRAHFHYYWYTARGQRDLYKDVATYYAIERVRESGYVIRQRAPGIDGRVFVSACQNDERQSFLALAIMHSDKDDQAPLRPGPPLLSILCASHNTRQITALTRLSFYHTTVSMHLRFLAACIFVLSRYSADAEGDVKEILKQAAVELAWKHGTEIQPHYLASGFCFSRTDQTDNAVKCTDEPARRSTHQSSIFEPACARFAAFKATRSS